MTQTSKINGAQLSRLTRRLFADKDVEECFVNALKAGTSGADALIWLGERPEELPFKELAPLPWQPDFVGRPEPGARAGQSLLHQRGCYYCLDLSSVFEASVLRHIEPPSTVLDMCASPGGKSVFVWRLFRPRTVISNESVGKRVPALLSNLKRCAVPGFISSVDPARAASAWPEAFDLVIVDAPCSGQSLLARGEENPGCLHPLTVNKNSSRQKRIVACSAECVAPGGFLAYMTCTFSPEENEEVMHWLLKKFPEFEAVEVPPLACFRSSLTDVRCYRVFPFQGAGAGGFTCLLKKRGARRTAEPDLGSLRLIDVRVEQKPGGVW